eukprot:gene7891-9999_t
MSSSGGKCRTSETVISSNNTCKIEEEDLNETSQQISRQSSDRLSVSMEHSLAYPVSTATPAEEQATIVPASSKWEYENVHFEDIIRAKYQIMDGVPLTPCELSHNLSPLTEMKLYFKREYQLRTGSFKERGARNALKQLTPEQKQRGVIAASAGNHALGLAYHGNDLNIPVTLVMPVFAPLTKVENCRSFGANVIISGAHIGESMVLAKELAKKEGVAHESLGVFQCSRLQYINGYNDVPIIAGQGTIGLEVLEQVPDVEAIIVPVGGGGLIAGVALAVKTIRPDVEVIGVESVTCPSFSTALEHCRPHPVEVSSTLADGLSVPIVGGTSFHVAKDRIDKMITVRGYRSVVHVCFRERDIAIAVLRLLEMEKAIVEGSGACGLAALLSNYLPHLK